MEAIVQLHRSAVDRYSYEQLGSRSLALVDVGKDEESSWQRFVADDGTFSEIGAEDEAALFYTSGTTGPPKGVSLSHKNLIFPLETVAATELMEHGDRVMLPLPLHHV